MIDSLLVGLFFLALPGALAFAGARLLVHRSAYRIIAGIVLVVLAGIIPLTFAYAWSIGVVGAAVGVGAAAFIFGARIPWLRRTTFAAAFLVVILEPILVINIGAVRADEAYSRCAADKAVGVVETIRAQGRGYPSDVHEIALADGEYGDTPCYVSSGVKWLYRVENPGSYAPGNATYTLGYWIDWRVARRVCTHSAGMHGWRCGFEMWGRFRPGEVD